MPFDEFPDFCSLVQDIAHIYNVITNPLNSLPKEEACSENILQKQISLVPSKNKQLTGQHSLMYVFFQEDRMHHSTEEIQLHGILRNEQLARDLLTFLNLWKRKAFGDVHHFSFMLEDASLQNKGSHNSLLFFFFSCKSITLQTSLSSSDCEVLCNKAM